MKEYIEGIQEDDLLDIDGVSNSETGLDERNFTFVYDIMANQIIKPDSNHQVGNIYVDNNDIITATTGSNVLSVTADGYRSDGKHPNSSDPILDGTESSNRDYTFNAHLDFQVSVLQI